MKQEDFDKIVCDRVEEVTQGEQISSLEYCMQNGYTGVIKYIYKDVIILGHGTVYSEIFYLKGGNRHNERGWAWIDCDNTNDGEYYLDDIKYTKDGYYKELLKRGLITEEEIVMREL
jgi:hypothetical protein